MIQCLKGVSAKFVPVVLAATVLCTATAAGTASASSTLGRDPVASRSSAVASPVPLPKGYVTFQNNRGIVTARYKLSWQALQKQLEKKWGQSKLKYGSQRLADQTSAWSFWVKVGSKYYAGSITDCAKRTALCSTSSR